LSEELQGKDRKTTVNLAIDSTIIEHLKRDAKAKGMSLNSRINGILKKYIQVYKIAEEVDDVCMMPKSHYRFIVDNINEKKHTYSMTQDLLQWIPFHLNERNIPLTLENVIKYSFEIIAVGGRVIDSFTHYTDIDGNINLVFKHVFGIKFSRMAGTATCQVLKELLNLHATFKPFHNNFVVRIAERDVH
jgi:hypothetical protein